MVQNVEETRQHSLKDLVAIQNRVKEVRQELSKIPVTDTTEQRSNIVARLRNFLKIYDIPTEYIEKIIRENTSVEG